MLAKHACHFLAAEGRPALHLAYWLRISLEVLLPAMASGGLMVKGDFPVHYAGLLTLHRELFFLDWVDTGRLQEVKSTAIYKEFTLTLPAPLVESRGPLTDQALLFLAWPPEAARDDAAGVLAVITSSDVLSPSPPPPASRPEYSGPPRVALSAPSSKQGSWPRGLHL
jgi:hypothetical protein